MRLSALIAVLATGLVLAFPSVAQQPQTVRLRGAIETIDGPNLMVKSRNGDVVKVRLADNARASAIVKASVADLKPNTYIGVTSVPAPDGSDKAIAVHIFPEERRGTAEGRMNWDLLPESKMTNGAVNLQVQGVQGGIMTVTYKGQESKIALGPETAIVAFVAGERSELNPGTQIIIFAATRNEDGTLQAPAITYGRDGLKPPM
ncbi:MAG: hypothetical protein QOG66_2086 [Methylobacteriaceae bacterium]|jgi:hypothetical protein|nr:hypothetical protein [Methylobacteriaceae bacterium]